MVEFVSFLLDAVHRFLGMELAYGISYYTIILVAFIGVVLSIIVRAVKN